MGWAAGTEVFQTAWEKQRDALTKGGILPGSPWMLLACRALIEGLEQRDWDTQDEVIDWAEDKGWPEVRQAFQRWEPEYYGIDPDDDREKLAHIQPEGGVKLYLRDPTSSVLLDAATPEDWPDVVDRAFLEERGFKVQEE